MRIECPSCHFSADVASEKLPAKGGNARCPKCSGTFFVQPPPPLQRPAQAGPPHQSHQSHQSDQSDQPELSQQPPQKTAPAAPAAATASAEAGPDSLPFGNGRSEIVRWVEQGHIDKADGPAALRLAGAIPGPSQWRRFLDRLALWLGAIFLAAAVIFFFAYNWQELGRFARFGIVEILLAAAVLAAWRTGLETMAGKASVFGASLMVGALLALVGQTYQTGADPWELFATWAALVLPWVALSRFAPLWLLWIALLNLSATLYYHVFAGLFTLLFGTLTLWWTLAALNTAALAIWEITAARGVSWLSERWPQRLLATAGAGYVTLAAIWAIVDSRSGTAAVHIIGYLAWAACACAVYRHKIVDLYVLALGILSLIVVVSVWLSHDVLGHDSSGGFLLVGMVVLGMSAAGGWWLRNVAREVEA